MGSRRFNNPVQKQTVSVLCFRVTAHLFEFLISQTVELYDELAVSGGDLSTGVDDLDDVQLLPQAHLCAHLPTQVLDVLHLKVEVQARGSLSPGLQWRIQFDKSVSLSVIRRY